MEALYKAYKGKAQFFLVYLREAHPSRAPARTDKPQAKAKAKAPARRPGNVSIAQPKTMAERVIAADKCMKGLELTIPILLDSIEGDFIKAYTGFQAGTVVIDIDGKIAYWTRGGPWGCKPAEAEAALKKLIASGGSANAKEWADVKIPPDKPTGKKESTPTTKPASAAGKMPAKR